MKLAPGSKIGIYQILGPLGAGGMGEVYKAHDPQLMRDAVIKVLPEHISAQSEALARLENEARLASSLNHPNIVTIYSIGWEGPRRYIAMEYIDGPTLQDLINAGPMPLDQVISVAAQIADGLAKAHEAGIIHRDLKPKNVMLTRDGIAKILDFGLSKLSIGLVDSEAPTLTYVDSDGLTKPGAILGTVEYMSPEQAAGRQLDFRSDQFSMGSLIYALLTGRKPFHKGTPVQTLSRIIESEPQPVSELVPHLPQALEALIRKCMMKDPRDRYASTRDIARDLREMELTRKMPARRWTRRELIRASLVLGLSLAGGSGLWMWLRRPYQPQMAALEWYQKGQAALQSMAFDTARKAFEKAVEIDPKFALAHGGLAISYDSMDYSGLAAEAMVRASAIAEETRISAAGQRRLQALRYIVSRDYDLALPLVRELEKDADGRDKPAAALELGWLAERREDTEGAAAAYERAVKMNQAYAAAKLRLGFIQQRQGGKDTQALKNFDEAERLYNSASDDEGRTETLYNRANLLLRRGRPRDSSESIDKAIAIAKATGNRYQEIRLQLLQSMAARNLGHHEDARKLAEAAIEAAESEKMDNVATSALVTLGNAFFQREEYESAEKSYRSALDKARRDKLLRYEALASVSLASLCEQKNQPKEAKHFADVALPFYRKGGYGREFIQAMVILGGALHQLGEYEEGLKVLREVLPRAVQLKDPGTEVRLRERIADNLKGQGDWPAALRECEQAASMPGDPVYVRLNCAWLDRKLGRRQGADQYLSAAAKMMKNNPDAYDLASLKLRQAEFAYEDGRLEEAKKNSREAIDAMPTAGNQIEPEAKLIEALVSIRTGRKSEGLKSALQIISEFDGAGLAGDAASARLSTAEALASSTERSIARKLVAEALDFFEGRRVWESVFRGHLVAARVSDESAEAESHRASAQSALQNLRRLWPAADVNSYLERADIKYLSGGTRF